MSSDNVSPEQATENFNRYLSFKNTVSPIIAWSIIVGLALVVVMFVVNLNRVNQDDSAIIEVPEAPANSTVTPKVYTQVEIESAMNEPISEEVVTIYTEEEVGVAKNAVLPVSERNTYSAEEVRAAMEGS